MAKERVQRRLAAILAADMVGYSRLMEADETGTIARQKAHRSEVMDPEIAGHGGRIVKTTGDGMLVEFPSVVEATECAVAIQRAMAAREADIGEDRRIRYRVGINLGDIVIDGDDILGDGVNVAARLEGLSEPGGICLSDVVHQSVAGKLDLAFEDIGAQQVKNIARPVHAYRVQLDEMQIAPSAAPSPPTDKPSIAVLPFDNMSGDPEQEFFADGLAEDIIAILSKTSKLMVIARNSSFAYKDGARDIRRIAHDLGVRYVLEGSVRKSGDRLRVTAQLIDAAGGSHLWAERYDRRVEDFFDIQDDITKEIVTALRVQLTDGEDALAWNKGTQNIDAWRWALEAGELFFRLTPADITRAQDLIRRSIELDPDYAYAWALNGCCQWYLARIGSREDAEALIGQAEQSVAKALDLDDTNSYGHLCHGVVLLYRRQFDEAVSAMRKAVALLPGDSRIRAVLGFVLIHAGRPSEGLQAVHEAFRLNPHAASWYQFLVGRAHDMLGDLDQAVADFRGITQAIPFASHIHLASLLMRLGRTQEAKDALSEALRVNPQFNSEAVVRYLMCRDDDYVKSVTDSLRAAGLPD